MFTRNQDPRPTSLPTAIRNAVLTIMIGILMTFSVDAALLLKASFSEEKHISDTIIVFSIGSILLWMHLIVGVTIGVSKIGLSLWGCWVMYLIGDLARLLLDSSARDALHKTMFALRIARVICLFTLCGLAASRAFYKDANCQCDQENRVESEARRSLLRSLGNNPSYSVRIVDTSYANNSIVDIDVEENKYVSSHGLKTLKFAIPFFWPMGRLKSWLLLIGVGLCLLADRLLIVYVPIQLGVITNALVEEKTLPWAKVALLVFLRILASNVGTSALRTHLWSPLERYAYQQIAIVAFNHVMDLSCDFHDENSTGSVQHAIGRGTVIPRLIRTVLFQLGPMITDLFVAIIVLYVTFGLYTGLITAATTGLIIWLSSRIVALQKSGRRRYMSAINCETKICSEATTNWHTATWSNMIDTQKHSYSLAVDHRLRSEISVRRWTQIECMVRSVVLLLGLICTCHIAAQQVSTGSNSIGKSVMLLGYWIQLSVPFELSTCGFTSFALDIVDAGNFIAILKKKPFVTDRHGAKKLRIQEGILSFKEVTFSYDKSRQALKEITFEAQPGQTIALVGDTGSGKSTIFKLLIRLYDPDYGSIELDGQNVSEVLLRSLRSSIGVVHQHPMLFNDTLYNNLKYARRTATTEEIHHACAAVKLHEKFLSFPDGYDTKVGERGVKLSTGELRRVAMAQVILMNPKYILLDEAVSDIEGDDEAHIRNNLAQLTAGRTTLVIAHHLSTVIKAHQILVLKDGSVIDRGDHQSLLKRSDYYCQLWNQQVGLDSKFNRSALKADAPEFLPSRMTS